MICDTKGLWSVQISNLCFRYRHGWFVVFVYCIICIREQNSLFQICERMPNATLHILLLHAAILKSDFTATE